MTLLPPTQTIAVDYGPESFVAMPDVVRDDLKNAKPGQKYIMIYDSSELGKFRFVNFADFIKDYLPSNTTEDDTSN